MLRMLANARPRVIHRAHLVQSRQIGRLYHFDCLWSAHGLGSLSKVLAVLSLLILHPKLACLAVLQIPLEKGLACRIAPHQLRTAGGVSLWMVVNGSGHVKRLIEFAVPS